MRARLSDALYFWQTDQKPLPDAATYVEAAKPLGLDLSKPLDDETFARIRDAFFENEVVFFRNQKLTPQQQVDFTKRFGYLEQHVRKESRLDGHPEILVISNVLDANGKFASQGESLEDLFTAPTVTASFSAARAWSHVLSWSFVTPRPMRAFIRRFISANRIR